MQRAEMRERFSKKAHASDDKKNNLLPTRRDPRNPFSRRRSHRLCDTAVVTETHAEKKSNAVFVRALKRQYTDRDFNHTKGIATDSGCTHMTHTLRAFLSFSFSFSSFSIWYSAASSLALTAPAVHTTTQRETWGMGSTTAGSSFLWRQRVMQAHA